MSCWELGVDFATLSRSDMRMPRPRNLVSAIVVILVLIAAGLVIAQDQETLRVRTSLAAGDPRFPDYLATLLGHPLTSGDTYIVHTNGDQAFPAMLAAIDAAQAPHQLRDLHLRHRRGRGALHQPRSRRRRGAASSAGWSSTPSARRPWTIGTSSGSSRRGAESAGSTRSASFAIEEVNYRTHRKALVVDGDVAFVGGIGIADQWAARRGGRAAVARHALRGPRAGRHQRRGGVQRELDRDRRRRRAGPAACTREPMGKAHSIVVWSSPEGGANEMKLLYLLAIAAARTTLDIQSPYLITDESTQLEPGRGAAARRPHPAADRGRHHRRQAGEVRRAVRLRAADGAGDRDLRVPAGDDAHQGAWSSTACSASSGRPTSTTGRSS